MDKELPSIIKTPDIPKIIEIKVIKLNTYNPELTLRTGCYTKLKPNMTDKLTIKKGIKILNKYGILGADEGLTSSCSADQYKEQDSNQDNKVKEKDMDIAILTPSAAQKKTIGYRRNRFCNKVAEFAEDYSKRYESRLY